VQIMEDFISRQRKKRSLLNWKDRKKEKKLKNGTGGNSSTEKQEW
jgi:hypothetical protein